MAICFCRFQTFTEDHLLSRLPDISGVAKQYIGQSLNNGCNVWHIWHGCQNSSLPVSFSRLLKGILIGNYATVGVEKRDLVWG